MNVGEPSTGFDDAVGDGDAVGVGEVFVDATGDGATAPGVNGAKPPEPLHAVTIATKSVAAIESRIRRTACSTR